MTASNRAAMLYGDDPRALAAALDGEPSVDVALFLEDGEVVARRDGDEDLALLDEYPRRPRARRGGAAQPERGRGARLGRAGLGVRRPRRAATTSAAAATARSPPSDSEVPMLTVGLGEPPASITGDQGARARALRGRASRRAA